MKGSSDSTKKTGIPSYRPPSDRPGSSRPVSARPGPARPVSARPASSSCIPRPSRPTSANQKTKPNLNGNQFHDLGKMAFILGVLPMISDTSRPIGMKLWECIEFTLKPCIVIFSTSGRKSKPEVGLPHTISVLFWLEILPDDKVNDLESNELCINIGETGNTGENRKFS